MPTRTGGTAGLCGLPTARSYGSPLCQGDNPVVFHTNVCSCRTGGVTYVELHAHSAYSFLDGASQPEELAARAAELGYEALALTDHDGVYGSLEFAHAAKHLGVRAITGTELTLEGGAHITLLVETPQGHAHLCRILTRAHALTRPKEGREPLPPSVPQSVVEELHDGLVCLSGCARDGLAVH